MSRLPNINRCVDVGVLRETALFAEKHRLTFTVVFLRMTASGTLLAGMGRIDLDDHSSFFPCLVFKETYDLSPSLFQNDAIQAGFGLDVLAWRIFCAFCRFRHVLYGKVFHYDYLVSFA